VQQVRALVDDPHPTVLEGSLIEGSAEFVAELISGGVAGPELRARAAGHEKEIETAFATGSDTVLSSRTTNTRRISEMLFARFCR
jgi:hypothetical protein